VAVAVAVGLIHAWSRYCMLCGPGIHIGIGIHMAWHDAPLDQIEN